MRRRIMVASVGGVILAACARPERPAGGPQPEPKGPTEITVVATEYSFEVSETPQAGETTFVLENVGKEPHNFGLVRISGNKSVEELLRLPRKQADRFIEEEVGDVSAKPGRTRRLTVELARGRYGYACFVQGPDGLPHAFHGMYGEFTVA
jgi:uncharacterized cupredoxin-like copper-binding protein